MGLFALPVGVTWRDNLKELKSNLDLLEQNPDADHLWYFMEACFDQARVKYQQERELQQQAKRAA